MKRPFHDFETAFNWLEQHPCMMYRGELAMQGRFYDSAFPQNLDIYLAKVNPTTDMIDDDESKNTKLEIWFEVLTYTEQNPNHPEWYDKFQGASCHDWQLDTGGRTFEEAIIKLALKVRKYYGESGRRELE
jgi:hypothetical protein